MIFVVMTLTLCCKFLNQTYSVRTLKFTIRTRADFSHTDHDSRAGGGTPTPPSLTNVDIM